MNHKYAPTADAQLQLFGEYLHAFQDTFAHRDANDLPIDALTWDGELGWGHLDYGHDPDYTYNHLSLILLPGHFNWDGNEARTLVMEQAVFEQLKAFAARQGQASNVTFASLEEVLKAFNETKENEGAAGKLFSGPGVDPIPGAKSTNASSNKLKYLNAALSQLGAIPYYDVALACSNRQTFTDGLDAKDYPGVILNTPDTCATNRP